MTAPDTSAASHAQAPLHGLKVVELARVLAGPFAGQTLGDLGAQIIKVESPQGDDTRHWGPPWVMREDGSREAAYYHACNRNKLGVTADFTNADDLAFVKELCADADVVIENFKTGGLARFGLDYASLSADNPALIYCSITGFGHDGPYANQPGYDFVIQGMGGFMGVTGDAGGEPFKSGVSISDLTCGLYAVIAIQAALAMRAKTGRGQHIDMALLDCTVGLLSNQALYYLTTGQNPPRMGNAHAQVAPYQVYEMADGHLIVATGNTSQFQRLAQIIGRDDLATDQRLATSAGRVENRDWMNSEIAREMRRFTREEMTALCNAQSVPCGPVNTMEEVFANPQVKSREMQLALPEGIAGVRTPISFSDAQLVLDQPSPRHGQHNEQLRAQIRSAEDRRR